MPGYEELVKKLKSTKVENKSSTNTTKINTLSAAGKTAAESAKTQKLRNISNGTSYSDYVNKLKAQRLTESNIKSEADVSKWYSDTYSAISDMASYNKNNANKYVNEYGGNAAKRVKELLNSYYDVSDYLSSNKDSYENYDKIREEITALRTSLNQFDDFNNNTREYYSQWENEEAYNEDIAAYEKRKAMSTLDLDAEYKALEEKKKQYEEYDKARNDLEYLGTLTPNQIRNDYAAQNIDNRKRVAQNILAKYNGIDMDALGQEISEQTQYLTQAKRIQEYDKLSNITAPDFDEKSAYVSTKNNEWHGGLTSQYGLRYDDLTYEYINNVDGIRSLIKDMARTYDRYDGFIGEENGYDYMTEDEVKKYNYYYATEGKEKAQEYLDVITQDLIYRKANFEFEKFKDNTLAEVFYSIPAGLDQFKSGMNSLGRMIMGNNGEYINISDTQALGSLIREDLGDVGFKLPFVNSETGEATSVMQAVYDVGSTTSNMLPSIIVSSALGQINPTLGAITGNVLMGGSATGNTYQEMINLGYDDSKARSYALLIGSSEAALQYFLGGISSLSGLEAKGFVSSMLSEGVEEYIQEILGTYFKNELFDENNDINLADSDALYSGVLGALTAGFMEGPSALTGYMSYRKDMKEVGQKVKDTEGALDKLIDFSKQQPANTVAHKIANKISEKTGAYKIGKLLNEAGAALTVQNKADIERALTRRGVATRDARKLSDVLATIVQGAELTEQQAIILENNKDVADAVRETLFSISENEKHSVSYRTNEYTAILNSLNKTENTETETASKEFNAEENSDLVNEAETPETAAETIPDEVVSPAENEAQTAAETEETEVVTDTNVGAETEETAEDESPETIEEVAQKYGAKASVMIDAYNAGGGSQDVTQFARAYDRAYEMGKSGVSFDYVNNSESTSYLTETQKKRAYILGSDASSADAKALSEANKNAANGNKGRKKGIVKGEGVSLKEVKEIFNDTQNRAYKLLNSIAEVTGVDIVLYKSELNAEGKFVDAKGKEAAQGEYKRNSEPGTVYIDINAGLRDVNDVNKLYRYTMLKTFTHEFSHFIEKWSPELYNELRKVVFDTMTAKGENVDELIELKMDGDRLSYEDASREAVANSLVDILPESSFIETLANEHKTIFDKLLEKLKEFLNDLKEYFRAVGNSNKREAFAVKEQVGEAVRYVENIVKMFDKAALDAVENYQATVAFEEVTPKLNEKTTDFEFSSVDNEKTVKNEAVNESKSQEKEPLTETDPYGFTITDNLEYNSLEITFDGKPSETVRKALKANKFKWNSKKGVWYGYGERANIVDALHKAYEAESKPQETKPQSFAEIMENATQAERDEVIEAIDKNTRGFTRMMPTEIREPVETAETVTEEVTEEKKPEAKEDFKPQDTIFDKKTVKMLKSFGSLYVATMGKENYVTNGAIFLPINDADVVYAKSELNAKSTFLNDAMTKVLKGANTLIEKAPTEAKLKLDKIYIFDFNGIKRAFKKELLSFLDGGTLYYGEFKDNGGIIKSVNADGSIKGYLMGLRFGNNSASLITDEKESKLKSFAKKKAAVDTTEINKEAIKNGENVNTEERIPELDTNGQGTSRLLDEVQTEDVQGTESGRNTSSDTSERRTETSRNGDREPTDIRRSRSEGTGESGDLRRDDVLTPEQEAEEAEIKAEKLHEEVNKAIEQKSTETPKGKNFVINDSLNLPSGEKARFKANVEAIRLIKQLETEGRYATAAEQEILSKYVGWGGLSNAFGDYRYDKETKKYGMFPKDGWVKEFDELKALVTEGVITEQEYKDMSASTKNAHYTSVEVIKAMYDGLTQLGFKGGRMLEPSSGVGNFVGAMPTELTNKVNSWTMVELDRITGQIAKYLYPNADVRIQDFETANIPNNYMDVAIGNVPFGNFGVVDRTYPKRVTKSIHNYFFAKSIDKVRPGGIVMFITSSFTMDAKDPAIRDYIAERADLLGAIRLPNTSFKDNAGTEVVTDILILKKRESGTEYAGENFSGTSGEVNSYFVNHPEMVLGTPTYKRGMYGANTLTYEPLKDRGTIDNQIRESFKNIKGEMTYPEKLSPEKTNFAVERNTKKPKKGGLIVNPDGTISRNDNGQIVKHDVDEKTAKRIKGMLDIRDAYRNLANYLQQGLKASEIKKARNTLNTAYDNFVKEYGYINNPTNKRAIDSDPDSYSILSLENYDAKNKTAKKADIFTKDTISANRTVNSVDNVTEGVIVSLNLTGTVDAEYIAKLTSRTVEDVTREIIDTRIAFKANDGSLVARETYLSGNVRAKLREAEALAPFDKDYEHNVEELRKVIPKDIPYNEIYVTPGATFIPNEVYADFIAHVLGGRNNSSWSAPDVEVGKTLGGDYKIAVNNARLKKNYYNTQTWGTNRKSFLDLIDAMMNSRTVKVNDTVETADGRKISVLNEAETEAANEKVKAIQKEFEEWLWKDENRRTELARLYNETFNAIVNPKYDGSNLTVNGINPKFTLRPHQANAVHRVISSGGNTLLAHRVGAGKTLEMAAAAMKLRELGVVKKPVFVVPKSLVAQWGVEFSDYFPASRLLVADEKSFTPANRKVFTNKIANGDYDAIIVSYEQFEKIPMSVEYQSKFYEEQINEIIDAIAEEKAESRDGKGLTVKEMEKKKASLEKKLKELTSKPKDEDNIDFEMLGIDSLFVDEAHNFKNLEYVSKMTNVAGLGSAKGAQRSFDLYTKIRYLQQMNGGRGIVFATATPVMNSMVELYIMQRYLQPEVLEQLGLRTFDAWAKQFGEVVNKWEINPSGTGMRQKQVFANFKNLNELQLLFRSFSDVLTEVPGLKIPKMKGGAVKIVECEAGEFQKTFMKELQERAENVKNVDPSVDNMLKITSDGRKVSYTQRMIDPSLPYEAGCKLYRCCDNILREYKENNSIKGTQIVFCDMATPKGTDKNKTDNTENVIDEALEEDSAKLYDDMKAYLVKQGIPAKEIAFIHDADTDAKKKQLFEDVNNGKVRVLIGSTGKMGVGMNAQQRIVAIHHLDAPWRPGDVEQRDGRAFRQKNMNEEVSKYVYVTKGSFDSRLWDILDRKQHFINQIMNGEDVGRTAEDTGEVTLSAAEVKALASGNPLIEEQTKLTDAIKKLENLQKAYNSSIRLARTKLADDMAKINTYKNSVAATRVDIKSRVDTYSDNTFSMNIGGKIYTDKKDAGAALIAQIISKSKLDGYTTVANFAGFELQAIRDGAEYKGLIKGKGTYKFNVYMQNTTRMVNHIGEIVAGFENRITNIENEIGNLTADLNAQQDIIAKPFDKADELQQKRARFNEVMELLAPKNEQQHGNDSEDVQYQSRDYLDEDKPYSFENITPLDNESRANAISRNGVVITTENELIEHIDDALTDRTLKENCYLGILKNGVLDKIKKDIGVDIFKKGPYSFRVSSDDIRHIQEHFSTSGEIANAIYRLYDVINDYDTVELIREGTQTRLKFEKSYSDFNFLSIEIASKKSRSFDLVTFYVTRNNKKREGRIQNLANTSNMGGLASQVVPSSNENLPQNDNFVNREFTQEQQRDNSLSDREILELAANEIKIEDLTDGEKDALQIYKDRLTKLEDLQKARTEQGRLYREQQFGEKVDRTAAEATRNRMKVLDEQIERAKNSLFSIEEKTVIRKVLQKAKKVVIAEERAHGQEILKRYRDRRTESDNVRKYRERIRADVNEFSKWVLHPNNKDVLKHIPDALKDSIIPFITSIDFTSKRALKGGAATKADKVFFEQITKLKDVLSGVNNNYDDAYSQFTDLPPDFMQKLSNYIDAANTIARQYNGEFVINRMNAEQLKSLSQIIKTLKIFVEQFNKFHTNAIYKHVYEAGDSSVDYMKKLATAGRFTGKTSEFVMWKQIRPAYAFERFGNGGKAIYDGLRRGQAKLAFNTKQIVDFSERTYTEKEVQAWEKEIKEVKLGNDIVRIPVSYIMSFYELSKQEDSLRHILGEGVRVATHKEGIGKGYTYDTGHLLTQKDVNTLIKLLTPRQKEVADALQKYMADVGGKWGNYVSMARFGEELFGEKDYFPINSDGRHLEATADEHPEAASLYALLNMSFTISRNKNAKNRIILYSIFDVFSNHMASMAQYNALALPVIDTLKWFNYTSTVETESGREKRGSVREEMARVYGAPVENRPSSGKQSYAEKFVINIIKAFNGTEVQGSPNDSFMLNQLHRYNIAQVAYNTRVIVQQPLAIMRAGALIDYRSILKGLKLAPSAIKGNIDEMRKYSGIAAWKKLGFYDVNISRGVNELIKHDKTKFDKFNEFGMKGAEIADTYTWASIWSACKEEVTKKHKLTPKSEGFYDAVTKLFEDVIYKTQVVDSVLTKNEYMRDKGFASRLMSSFMSEPVTTASMLLNAYDKYHTDIKRGLTFTQAWNNNKRMIGRIAYVYGITAILTASVQALADAWRDDDDYQDFLEKWLEAFEGNIIDESNPLNKLPIFSDLIDIFKEGGRALFGWDTYGNTQTIALGQASEYLTKGFETIHDLISGDDTNYTWYNAVYKTLQAASGLTGIPGASITREVVTVWNNIVSVMAPSLKVKTYDAGDKSEIKFAFLDGYLTAEEATDLLLEKGLAEDTNDAYWTIDGWENGGSKYDDLYEAVKSGSGYKEAVKELTTYGHTEKQVISQLKKKIGEWYKNGEITKNNAITYLTKYCDMDRDDVTAQVNKWSAVVVTGIEYDNIKAEYLSGNISYNRAIEMRVKYGGQTQEEATETVSKWKFENDYGISYDDIGTAFKNREITAKEMYNILTTTGGKSSEAASKSMVDYSRDAYLDGDFTRSYAYDVMTNFGGLTEEKAEAKLRYIDFKLSSPDTFVEDAWVDEYYNEVESSGISIEQFVDYRNSVKSINGDGKKKRRMDVINSLPLTNAQKDTLYYAEGWAESTIYEAPWH